MSEDMIYDPLNDIQPNPECKQCYGMGRFITDYDMEFNKRPYCKCVTDQMERLERRAKAYQRTVE